MGFISTATADTDINVSELTKEDIATIKRGAGNFLTCSIAIRSSFSMMDTIPEAKDEDGNPVEIRLHSLAESIVQETKKAFKAVGVEDDMVEDILAAKRTQWLYLSEHERSDILSECARALTGALTDSEVG